MTKLYGLLGWPVGHSVSPAMINRAFTCTGVDGVYVPFAVQPDRLGDALCGLAALSAGGVNVTIPHKQAVYRLVDELTEAAQLAGAVNTVRFEPDGRMTGHNTDIDGWWQSVAAVLKALPSSVCILGAGGAARAAVAALAVHASDCKVLLCARNSVQAQQLATDFSERIAVVPVEWTQRHQTVSGCQLVVNATSLGMWPHEDTCPLADLTCLGAHQVVQDMVYRPRQTAFLTAAEAAGATVIEGLSMLVGQGASAFTFWTGKDAPLVDMTTAASEALSCRQES